ncbi:cyclin-domain-containing protein [Rhizopus microsporus var. microsporus]|uniref:Cyclin-domain-containing protein n=2 Tax=Rhizopus microsporus TaxID=58291 RepID=A0A2G4T4Y3_RHIZD|nr:cyclin-domain-containing protein [Rhizopus microsporus ATCC 52813]ORE04269.1 cyclin-domain-containing protein [Rhizopus microsporus var. microsporus]PHZ16058.1 cyclin-domain-containing protein [Rhizopus microsporus ATCC 52813]
MRPKKYHLNIAEYPTDLLVKIVADLLISIVKENDKLSNQSVTHFHSRTVPPIGIYAYLSRILKFTSFSNEALLSTLIYFDRIAQHKGPNYAVNSLTVHRLLITSILVASKFTSDVFYSNTRYAKVGGIPLCELNQLELEFLFLCKFDLHVKLENMQAYGDQLLTHALTQQNKNITSFPLSPPLEDNCKRKRPIDDHDTRISNKKLVCPISYTPDYSNV